MQGLAKSRRKGIERNQSWQREMALRRKTGCEVFPEAEQGKDEPEDVPVGASVWNNKASYGSHLFSLERNTKSGWRVCALLSGV